MVQRVYDLEPTRIADSSGNYFKIVTLRRICIYNFIINNLYN